jgi:hypothetical protein
MITPTFHLTKQAEAKGFDINEVMRAANDPSVRYPSRNHPGQHMHVRGKYVVVVEGNTAITTFLNITPTPLRPDQR